MQWHKACTESPKITAEAKKANTETDRTELINVVSSLQTTDETIIGMDVGKSLHVVIRGPQDPETGERPQRYASEEANFERIGQLIRPTVPDAHAENYRIVASMEAGFRKRVRAYLPDNAYYLSWKLCRYMQRLSMNVVYKLIEVGSYAIL